MHFSKSTLAIYGIQDRIDTPYPAYVHDHSITFGENGRIIKHLHLERITRKKYDNSLHKNIKSLLKAEHLISPDNFDIVFVDNVVGRAFISVGGEVRFEAPLNSEIVAEAEKGKLWWFDHERVAYVVNHELAHVFSCIPFYGEFKENSLLVHFDGGASLGNYSVWKWENHDIKLLHYGWELRHLSTLFNVNALVFGIVGAKMNEQNAVPGKFMGFASFGEYSYEIETWLESNGFFENIWGKYHLFFEACNAKWRTELRYFDLRNKVIQNIAATIQKIFERKFLTFLQQWQEETSADYFYYTGGSALNIVLNQRIVESGLFKDVFIPPCTNDSGLSLGACAFVEYYKHRKFELHSPYLNNWGIEKYTPDYTKDDIKKIAKALIERKIIGVANGFAEIGPRALGNRSIVALANDINLAKELSVNRKGREWYRPVAPILLKENAQYFLGKEPHHLSKYMLMDFTIPDAHKPEIQGAVHVDGTSRFQVISARDENPFMFDLLHFMNDEYGIRALLNTSFNSKGEPIVHNETDALKSAQNMKLDGVVINGKYTSL